LEGFGDGDGWLDGDADGDPLGEALGEALGDPLGEPEGFGVLVQAPDRKGSWESPPHPVLTPAGRLYQSRMLSGSPLMNRFMIVSPTFSP
jgi:hypothetical protein